MRGAVRWAWIGTVWLFGSAPAAQALVVPSLETDVSATLFVCDTGGSCVGDHVADAESLTTAEVSVAVSTLDDPPGAYPFRDIPVTAAASAQTSYGIHRAFASTGQGGLTGVDPMDPFLFDLSYETTGAADSSWTDGWSFDADGTFSANLQIGGLLSSANSVPGYDALLDQQRRVGHRFYVGRVTGFTNPPAFCAMFPGACTPCSNFEDGCEVTQGEQIFSNIPNGTFNESVNLSFDYEAGHEYLVRSEFFIRAANGANLDFSSTAVVTDVMLSAGTLSPVSGTDYFNLVVPAPTAALLLPGGLAILAGARARARSRA
jgi:hypothetical protein